MTLKQKLEILSYLRDNNVEPTEDMVRLMGMVGFEHCVSGDHDAPDWYIIED